METEIDVDGFVDEKGICYIGSATRRPNGQWVCLADVDGCLCLVEVKIRLIAKALPAESVSNCRNCGARLLAAEFEDHEAHECVGGWRT